MPQVKTNIVLALDSGTQIPLKRSVVHAIWLLCNMKDYNYPSGRTVDAIKLLKVFHPLGLRDAKDAVYYIRDNADTFYMNFSDD